MPRSRPPLSLSVYGLRSNPDFERLKADRALDKMRKVDAQAREQGLDSLRPDSNGLIEIGMELEGNRVTKNGYGVFHLPWLAAESGDWAEQVETEIAEIRRGIQEAHGVPLKYLVWAGMGGSAEDKSFYQSAGLFKKVRVYILDSTDPAKLKAILDHIEAIDKQPLSKALRKCLIVGMAMGMTSFEPVLNLEKLDAIYENLKIPHRANFLYMTLPGSVLDKFASSRGFRRVELQLDGGNTTAGRHSGPMTRGSLYPLALNGADLKAWMRAALLSESEIEAAFELAGFLQRNALEGRDKLTLFLPEPWRGGAIWTKQDFEESLGKREDIGIKVAIGERPKAVNYFSPKEQAQDRCFLAVNCAGLRNPDAAKVSALRRAGYPVAVLHVGGEAAVARFMQFIHYTVFGLGYLRKMNFVTQPGVELYKKIANGVYQQSIKKGGTEHTDAWRELIESPCRVQWRGGLAVYFDALVELGLLSKEDMCKENGNAAAIYACALATLVESGKVSYGELTCFGDTRYNAAGRRTLGALDAVADSVFRSRLKMPADVYEGPAMNHSYHEMIIGYGRGFSTILLPDKQEAIKRVQYTADYHRAQWLATQKALAQKGRAVAPITIRDFSESSRNTLREFFAEVRKRLPRRRA